MLSENVLFYPLQLDVFPGEELFQREEAWFVLGLGVVAIAHLALQCCKLDALLSRAGMGAVNDGITRLGREGWKEGGRESGRERGMEGGREGGREGEREGGKEGRRVGERARDGEREGGGREGGRNGGREGGMERGREGGRQGG